MRLSPKQRQALEMLREPGQDGEPKTAEVVSEETCSDSFGVWVNHQTALALERRGLVKIDKQMDGWDLQLIDGNADA